MLKENPEKRCSARFDHPARITLESFEVGVVQEARMQNFSQSGLYFESDFYLAPGAEIYIGISNSPFTVQPGVYECYRSVIKWRRFLENSAYDYGYGIELMGKADRAMKAGEGRPARTRPRRPCSIPTLLQDHHRKMRGVIQNASRGGVFIRCAEELQKGQRVVLKIPLKKKQKLITRSGEIVWSDETGVGIKFEAE
jgi:hypothetical protein